MVRRTIVPAAALAAALAFSLSFAGSARADDAPIFAIPPAPPGAPPPAAPALHHVPVSTAREGESLAVAALVDRPDQVHRALLVYRHLGSVEEIEFRRSTTEAAPYLAVIPAEHVNRPSLAYCIEIERTDGARTAVFASRDAMHTVEVVGDTTDAREEALLSRVHGRRFVLATTGQYAYFGATPSTVTMGGKSSPVDVHDNFYQVEGSFTYRLLRTVSEFGIRAGVYRGSSPVPGATSTSQFNVGLNYGAPWVRLRAADWLHVEGELLSSVTEVGFSVGGGGAIIVGDPYSADLNLGFEAIEVFGMRGYSRFEARALPWLQVAPMIEVTTMPHASSAGVRLLLDLGFDLGKGFSILVRGGYQARSFAAGGPATGGTLSYAF